MKRILIITGPGGDAQGWGNLEVTEELCKALNYADKSAEIVYVEKREELLTAIEEKSYDIIWSALYHVSEKEDIVGMAVDDDSWVADILDDRGLPYIGPDAETMKRLIHKDHSHRVMHDKGVTVPYFHSIEKGGDLPDVKYPAFVKPSCESRSVGISDDSVVHTDAELKDRVHYILDTLEQPALIEEYLPGPEYTVLMLANGKSQELLPGLITIDESHYKKYPILRSDLRGGLVKIVKPNDRIDESIELCRQGVAALNCLDHVRVDMRVGYDDRLKIIEVNGIPGLKPGKSWSPQIFNLYHASGKGDFEDYRNLVHRIVDSGVERYGLN